MGEFTVAQVAAKVSFSVNTARSRIKELEAAGRVRKTEEGGGRSPAKYIVDDDAPSLHGITLPELRQCANASSLVSIPETVGDKT